MDANPTDQDMWVSVVARRSGQLSHTERVTEAARIAAIPSWEPWSALEVLPWIAQSVKSTTSDEVTVREMWVGPDLFSSTIAEKQAATRIAKTAVVDGIARGADRLTISAFCFLFSSEDVSAALTRLAPPPPVTVDLLQNAVEALEAAEHHARTPKHDDGVVAHLIDRVKALQDGKNGVTTERADSALEHNEGMLSPTLHVAYRALLFARAETEPGPDREVVAVLVDDVGDLILREGNQMEQELCDFLVPHLDLIAWHESLCTGECRGQINYLLAELAEWGATPAEVETPRASSLVWAAVTMLFRMWMPQSMKDQDVLFAWFTRDAAEFRGKRDYVKFEEEAAKVNP